jgi:hypothetical protein
MGNVCFRALRNALRRYWFNLFRYIPSELGYGDSGSPPKIKGGDPLIFQMEIIKIKVRPQHCATLRSLISVRVLDIWLQGEKKTALKCDPTKAKEESGCKYAWTPV